MTTLDFPRGILMNKDPLQLDLSQSAFSVAIIPDTHIHDRLTQSLHESQIRWIVQNQKHYAIKQVIHLGDIVHDPQDRSQWIMAQEAASLLQHQGLTIAYTAGNHNLSDWHEGVPFHAFKDDSRRDNEPYLFFVQEIARLNNESLTYFSENGWNSYHFVTYHEQSILILMLDYAAGNATFAWAKKVLQANRCLPTIIATHVLIAHEERSTPSYFEYPEARRIWDELIEPFDQVFLAIGGHYFGQGRLIQKNKTGKDVLCLVTNYQHWNRYGEGMMNLMVIDNIKHKLQWRSFSPFLLNQESPENSANAPILKNTLNHFDYPLFLK
jgi:hypothetical protein